MAVDAAATTEQQRHVTLISCEAHAPQTFSLSVAAARQSELIANAFHLNDDSDDDNNDSVGANSTMDAFALPKIKGPCLALVVDFLEHHVRDPCPKVPYPLPASEFGSVDGGGGGCVQQEWVLNFLQPLRSDQLLELLAAANFLNVAPLLELVVVRITFDLCGKSGREVQEYIAPALRARGRRDEEEPAVNNTGNEEAARKEEK
mmetsp:Transcript_4278/g.11674  ORF Transcript_4278/g.11674 Transcript_4278/m.11674 type:complete len:204 (+) Transcript_4278:117-728(+)